MSNRTKGHALVHQTNPYLKPPRTRARRTGDQPPPYPFIFIALLILVLITLAILLR